MKTQLGAVFLLKTSGIHHQAPKFCPITSYLESVVRSHFLLFIEDIFFAKHLSLGHPSNIRLWSICLEITHETTICCVKKCSKNTHWLNHGSIFYAEVALWCLIIHIYLPVCSSAAAETFLNPQSHRSELLVFNMSLESVGVLHRRYGLQLTKQQRQSAVRAVSLICSETLSWAISSSSISSSFQFPALSLLSCFLPSWICALIEVLLHVRDASHFIYVALYVTPLPTSISTRLHSKHLGCLRLNTLYRMLVFLVLVGL